MYALQCNDFCADSNKFIKVMFLTIFIIQCCFCLNKDCTFLSKQGRELISPETDYSRISGVKLILWVWTEYFLFPSQREKVRGSTTCFISNCLKKTGLFEGVWTRTGYWQLCGLQVDMLMITNIFMVNNPTFISKKKSTEKIMFVVLESRHDHDHGSPIFRSVLCQKSGIVAHHIFSFRTQS